MSDLFANPEKCRQRRRLAAKRDEVEAAPVRFLPEAAEIAVPGTLLFVAGDLPETREEELAAINALLPENAPPLSADQVYVHYVEAANGSFIADRSMFLGESTLKNIARDAARGVAFMNSHRTGGLSQPSELPFGKSFAGRYEAFTDEQGREARRALIGFYMLRGVKPNGDGGPTTDDLNAAILGGTLFDVSVGLHGGASVCDVDGHPLHAWDEENETYLCPHVPGTRRKMSDEECAAQEGRGVAGGVASYSLQEAGLSEFSACYDGAVPGAGFRKATALARAGALSREELECARGAYRTLLARGDFPESVREEKPRERTAGRKERRMNWLDQLKAFISQAEAEEAGNAEALEVSEQAPPARPPAAKAEQPPARDAVLEAKVRALEEQLAAQDRWKAEETQRRIDREATRFAEDLKRAEKLTPREIPVAIALYRAMAADDAAHPESYSYDADSEGKPVTGTRLEMFTALFAARPGAGFSTEWLGGGLPADARLVDGERGGKSAPMSAERREYLQSLSATGRNILAREKNGGKR